MKREIPKETEDTFDDTIPRLKIEEVWCVATEHHFATPRSDAAIAVSFSPSKTKIVERAAAKYCESATAVCSEVLATN